MALLNLKKNTAAKPAKSETPKKVKKLAVVVAAKSPVVAMTGDLSNLIIRARVTEKTTLLSQQGRSVHVFEVSRSATKKNIAEAIAALYKVTAEKVAILKIPPKKSMVQGRMSKGKTYRKAYVYLKKGETIDLA